jgi:hypothetical protein
MVSLSLYGLAIDVLCWTKWEFLLVHGQFGNVLEGHKYQVIDCVAWFLLLR